MRLKGSPPDGVPALSFVGSPTGSIIGSASLPIGKIISVPGTQGAPGEDGVDGVAAPHNHPISGVTGLQSALDAKADSTALANKADLVHTHAITSIVGLQDALDTKQTAAQVQAMVDAGTASLVDSSPATLDTLNELAAALGDDPNFATTIATQIGGKAASVHTHAISDVTGLQTALDAKLASQAGTNVVYIKNASSVDSTVAYSSSTTANTIMYRTTGGVTSVGEPTASTHATSKNYVDTTRVASYTGQTPTLWYGTQAQYDALASGTKNAAGFVAVIRP